MLTENQIETTQDVKASPAINNSSSLQQQQYSPESSSSSKRWVLLSSILFVLVLGLAGYIFFLNRNSSADITTTPPNDLKNTTGKPTTNLEEQTLETRWVSTTPVNKVLHIGPSYLLNYNNPQGTAVEQFSPQIVNDNNHGINTYKISPDKKKILFSLHSDDSGTWTNYIATVDGKILEEVNIQEIENQFGKGYAAHIAGWSLDSQSLVINARDKSMFGDQPCCEGDDNRVSKQIISTYDIDTHALKEIYTVNAAPIEIKIYDPEKQVLVYLGLFDSQNSRVVDLNTRSETAFDDQFLINYSFTNTYFVVSEQDHRVLKIYSIYEPTKVIGEAVLDESDNTQYTNWVTWSPNNTYFAINAYKNDNTGMIMTKIYDKTGTLVSTIINRYGGRGIFSDDEKFFLLAYSTNLSDGQLVYNWEVINVITGEMDEGVISNPTIGQPIYWFN